MSIASHFFIATPEEAARNDGLENASEDQLAVFYKVLFTGIEPIYKILANADCPEFELVSNDDDFAVLTFIFPSEFVTQLASFDDERFDFLIAEWRKFEEVPYDNEDDLRDLFTNLVRLARAADQSGLNMYLWNCL